MRALAAMVATVAMLGVPSVAGAAANVPVIFDGGTAEERALISEVLSWPELPPLANQITVVVAGSGSSYAGCGGIVLGTVGEVSILHEYGHVWDCQRMNQEYRRFIMECGDGDCLAGDPVYGWEGGGYDVRPSERFAQSFAAEVEYRRHGTRTPLWWAPYPSKLVGRVMDALTPSGGSCL